MVEKKGMKLGLSLSRTEFIYFLSLNNSSVYHNDHG